MSDNTNAQILIDLAIDFGSTNTVMAWKVYEVRPDGSKTRSGRFTALDADEDGISITRIPSVMIFKDENPNNVVVPKDLYGEDARGAIRRSNISPKVRDNFKQYLYTCLPDSDEYKRGVELTIKFFGHLRQEYIRLIYNRLPSQMTVAVNLYLSTPVRADPTHRSLMRGIAEEAGFTSEIGVRKIITDYDEALCVVRYAMAHEQESMKHDALYIARYGMVQHAVMANKQKSMNNLLSLARQREAIILFVDIGGSTTDMNLARLSISPTGITMNFSSFWPDSDVKYPLGGYLIDEAIRDYLINEGFADEKYTMNCWEHSDGKDRFRIFKEQNNLALSQGKCVEKLGMLRNVCYDSDYDDFEPRKYKNSPRRINDTIFRGEICAEYIAEMRKALKAIFTNQRPVNGKPPIRPEDVDGILLSGAGSLLYFVRDIFLDEKTGFKKIQRDPSQLHTWDDPSLCCAKGALADQTQVNYFSYARDNYHVRYDIFKSVNVSNPIFSGSFPLVKKHQMLPYTVKGKESFSYTGSRNSLEKELLLRLSLWRVDSSGEEALVGKPAFWIVDNNASKAIVSLMKLTVAAILQGPTGVFKHLIWKRLCDVTANAEISYSCTLTEGNQVKFRFKLAGSFHHLEESDFEVSL